LNANRDPLGAVRSATKVYLGGGRIAALAGASFMIRTATSTSSSHGKVDPGVLYKAFIALHDLGS
jgi:hypothetical protein